MTAPSRIPSTLAESSVEELAGGTGAVAFFVSLPCIAATVALSAPVNSNTSTGRSPTCAPPGLSAFTKVVICATMKFANDGS